MVNGSIVNIDTEDNADTTEDTVTIASADVGFPRSETIAAFGHRPYTGDLEPVRILREKLMKGQRNEGNDDNGDVCRKCGHYCKRQ